MWDFIHRAFQAPSATADHTPTNLDPAATQSTQHTNDPTPPTTPIEIDITPLTPPNHESSSVTPGTHQTPLRVDKHNDPWGDIWAIPNKAHTFRIASKNTGTLNPQNLDMQAITAELVNLSVSVFAAQETNIHWDTLTNHQIYQQCKSMDHQIKLTTASSQEPAEDWYQPGGTMLLTLNPWTSRIVAQGSDTILGRWTYQEFLGKNDKHVVIISGYCVCHQKFDAASNTVSAQQIRLMQARGSLNPKPRKLFLTDIISQIQRWRQANKEVILCINANDPVDDP